ncbi:bifunctional UDP-N-acetylglucosamine diphosphorylase/glucosamine-1-phosphate N-acetyltransferase GlmU [Piscirickettsia litoralis]|uniref:Bifunctional protein GlmU n=1 Tax=Piscirickettsia litoralis TaxID=1891921 RepID=A0ABX3A3E6_9GAMM|nr:bifunctional UDP-N-acetylglucosamine diphosphorylase/glucosamine-1-phosphate N-acetyltransferase GlmU [Piscirickettsia litoralis]ODN43035.1 UDP-N-acetylglucosamine diphosphorylase/glucosamine-1-phosphate N-acetyltransferase [Piscirickettsia litoralis]
MSSLTVVILAAGQGTRMRSSLPKVLHPLAGKPLINHVTDLARSLTPKKIIIVYGHGGEQLQAALANQTDLVWAKQQEQLGTGDAVRAAMDEVKTARCLVLNADVPLLSEETVQRLVTRVDNDSVGVLTADVANPYGYGRIVRDSAKQVKQIIEEKDATDLQKKIVEINSGVFIFPIDFLKDNINKLENNNNQKEYYLTDLVEKALEQAVNVNAVKAKDPIEIEGVNTRVQLAKLERCYQDKKAQQLMLAGVYLADPSRLDIRGDVTIGQDTGVDINVVLAGNVAIGKNCIIEPGVIIKNSKIADNVHIKAYSVIENSEIARDAEVGPFARLRPETKLQEKARIGNFVEVKKSTIGVASKANHLSYIGDSIVGAGVNIGAGAITCNYDGVNKHQTIINDKAFVGSNCVLVAPIEVGVNAMIGAGSTVSRHVPEDQLTVARTKQKSFNWQRPEKNEIG